MEDTKLNKYMELFLGELGWDKGTRIPLADSINKDLETLLISRQQDIQQLKEVIILQSTKCKDLSNYKQHVQTEYQENTKLLFANKQLLEQEIKLKQLAGSEADVLDHDVITNNKNSNEIGSRVDRIQINIGRLLKKADMLKNEVCGERGALQEWRAALERSAGDISAIEQFTKQDISKAKALETKRQKLKVEHDHMQERLNQLVSNLSAEERSCERISVQVLEGMEQRQQMMEMWSAAVENLRQRDNDIKHIREDYKVLEDESSRLTEQSREQQTFCDQQRGNNADAERDNMAAAHRLSLTRQAQAQLVEHCLTLDTEVQAMQRELSNIRVHLEKLHMENRNVMEEQYRKDMALKTLNGKIEDLKEKKTDTQDKTQSSEKRAKELERMLTDEERFTNQLNMNQQRAMHCSFVEQQKLASHKHDEKMFYMQLKAMKANISKLETRHRIIEKNLLAQKETLYTVFYQVETIGARVSHMEGARSEREFSAELVEREKRLQDVRARHAARVALLERHSGKLEDDLRRLTRDLEAASVVHTKLQSRLKSLVLTVEGGEKEVQNSREAWRRARVDEALLRVRLAQAMRALSALTDAAYNMDTQRLHLEAAMKERLVEINARQDMFNVQKRALFEECGKLKTDIKERELRIGQLKKRYDIFIASLGKDDSGEQLSVTFFKVKIAAERAELRERGAALDAALSRGERDVAALEHALRLVSAAHAHFLRRLAPLSAETPEMEEIQSLHEKFYSLREELQQLRSCCDRAERELGDVIAGHTAAAETHNQLTGRESDVENELEGARERLRRQEGKLENARESLRGAAVRARRLLADHKQWRLFQIGLWVREYVSSAHAALTALSALPDATVWRSLSVCLAQHHLDSLLPKQRALHNVLLRIITNSHQRDSSEDLYDESLISRGSSSRTASSIVSCNTRRLRAFRDTLASKLDEPSLATDKDNAPRSSVSLSVVTLGLDKSTPQSRTGSTRQQSH